MAEFVEVMRQQERMCKTFVESCFGCSLQVIAHEKYYTSCATYISKYPAEAEKIIMAWAAEHPEPKYPSWNEAWKQLFPDAFTSIHSATNAAAPCLQYFMKDCRYEGCNECREQPIPADIAEKLGIKPLEV